MFGRGDLTTVDNTGYASTANNLPWLMADDYQTKNPNFVYNIVYTFSPTVVNEFNVGWAGWDENTVYNPADVAKVTLGAGGFNLPRCTRASTRSTCFPLPVLAEPILQTTAGIRASRSRTGCIPIAPPTT